MIDQGTPATQIQQMLLKTVPVLPAVYSSKRAQGTGPPAAMVTENSSLPLQKQLLGVVHHLHSCTELPEKYFHLPVEICMGHALILQPSSCNRGSQLTAHKTFIITNNTKTNTHNFILSHNHHSYCVLFQDAIFQLQIHKLRYRTLHKSTEWGSKILTITYEPLWEIL